MHSLGKKIALWPFKLCPCGKRLLFVLRLGASQYSTTYTKDKVHVRREMKTTKKSLSVKD